MGSSIIHSVVSTQPKHLYIIQQNPPLPSSTLGRHTSSTQKKRKKKNTHSSIWLKLRVFLSRLHVLTDSLTDWVNFCLHVLSELI